MLDATEGICDPLESELQVLVDALQDGVSGVICVIRGRGYGAVELTKPLPRSTRMSGPTRLPGPRHHLRLVLGPGTYG